ncbi:hypothetical protein O0L34_g4912 [Tuta absoluta]|nr:hypothetical protein O0L34_g14263 [Tuta absoluta]KAJ2937996.1 hypothetical protein O0L34_g14449 [Tuta absoluta]KAJ2945994.1 hypothetical protein O0L34_g4912 [Tuta absoluta]
MAKFSLPKLEELMQKCIAPVLREVELLREAVVKLEKKLSATESLHNDILVKSSVPQQSSQETIGMSQPLVLLQQAQHANDKPAVDTNLSARAQRANNRQGKKPIATEQHKAAHAQSAQTKTPVRPATPIAAPGAPTKRENRQGSDGDKRIRMAGKLAFNDERSLTSENDWQEVQRNKRKSKKVLVGTSNDTGELQSVEKLKFIQAWSFKPETTEDQLRNYLNNIEKCDDYVVEKRNIRTDRHAAFTIGMPESLYTRLISPTSWPQGVRVSDWIRFRGPPRGQRGSSTSQQPAAVDGTGAVPQQTGSQ